jgi:hypothetical protein
VAFLVIILGFLKVFTYGITEGLMLQPGLKLLKPPKAYSTTCWRLVAHITGEHNVERIFEGFPLACCKEVAERTVSVCGLFGQSCILVTR